MKKLMSIVTIVVLTTTSLQAQTSSSPVKFSLGVEPSLPIGTFGDAYSFGIGGSVQGELKVADELGLTLNAGYINYSGKDVGGFKVPSSGIIPVLAGAKYYAAPSFYIHGQLGASFGTSTGGGTNFTYSPGIGFMASKNFDILLKYVGYSQTGGSSSAIGARVAYVF